MLKIKQTDGPIMEGISSFIKDNQADMVVVARHNRNFFDRLFHRSLSKRMAYHTKIPLMVLEKDSMEKNQSSASRKRIMAGI